MSKSHMSNRRDLLKSRYGITEEQFNEAMAEQGNRCAICFDEFYVKSKSRMNMHPTVDHDHKSGAFRGILCRKCNGRLGYCKDNPETLRAKGYDEAAWYIERACARLHISGESLP